MIPIWSVTQVGLGDNHSTPNQIDQVLITKLYYYGMDSGCIISLQNLFCQKSFRSLHLISRPSS